MHLHDPQHFLVHFSRPVRQPARRAVRAGWPRSAPVRPGVVLQLLDAGLQLAHLPREFHSSLLQRRAFLLEAILCLQSTMCRVQDFSWAMQPPAVARSSCGHAHLLRSLSCGQRLVALSLRALPAESLVLEAPLHLPQARAEGGRLLRRAR